MKKLSLCADLNVDLQFCIPCHFTVFSYSAQIFLKTAGVFLLKAKHPSAQEPIHFHFVSKEPGAFEVC